MRSTSLALWFVKPIAARCLEYLLNLMSEEFADIRIVGICLSEKDGSLTHLTQLAQKSGIPVHIIHDVTAASTPQIKKEVSEFAGLADLGLIIGFPHKIPVSSITQCRQGVINLHFAPLPAYRGSGTLTHAIIDEAPTYGITFHYVDASLDTGDIIRVVEFPLDEGCSAYALQSQTEEVAFELSIFWLAMLLQHPNRSLFDAKTLRRNFVRGSPFKTSTSCPWIGRQRSS